MGERMTRDEIIAGARQGGSYPMKTAIRLLRELEDTNASLFAMLERHPWCIECHCTPPEHRDGCELAALIAQAKGEAHG